MPHEVSTPVEPFIREDAVPTIKRLMDAAIVAVLVADVVLTVHFFERGRPPGLTIARSPATTVAYESVTVTTAPSDVSSAVFFLLRSSIPGAQPYVCPVDDLQKWDYGRGTSTSQNWVNWNGSASGLLVNESYSYENPYPNHPGVTSTASKP